MQKNILIGGRFKSDGTVNALNVPTTEISSPRRRLKFL